MRREVSIHRIRIIWRKWILIGCDDHPRGWVERSRQLLERYESLPLEIARRAIHRQITQPPLPNRELAGGVVSDVPVHIGIDEIPAGSGESRQCRSEVLPVAGAVDVEKRVLEHAWLGGSPSQAQPLSAASGDQRAVARDPNRELSGIGSLDQNQFPLRARLLRLSAKQVSASSVVHLLDIQILHIELKVGDAPGDPIVVSHYDARSPRQSDAGYIPAGTLQVRHVPDAISIQITVDTDERDFLRGRHTGHRAEW